MLPSPPPTTTASISPRLAWVSARLAEPCRLSPSTNLISAVTPCCANAAARPLRTSSASFWLKAPAPAFISATTRFTVSLVGGSRARSSVDASAMGTSMPPGSQPNEPISARTGSERAMPSNPRLEVKNDKFAKAPPPHHRGRLIVFGAPEPAMHGQVERPRAEPAEVEMVDDPIKQRGHRPIMASHAIRLHAFSGIFTAAPRRLVTICAPPRYRAPGTCGPLVLAD